MSDSPEIKKKSRSSKTTLKDFDVKKVSRNSTEQKVKSEKLFRKKKSKSSSNVREFHKQRFKVSGRNTETDDELTKNSSNLRSNKSSNDLDSRKCEHHHIPLSSSTSALISKPHRNSFEIEEKVSTTDNDDMLQFIRYSKRKYWSEGFTGICMDEIEENESNKENMFAIQAFNLHLVYEKMFKDVPHVNFLGHDPEVGIIFVSITKEPVDDENNVIASPKAVKKQLSDKTLRSSKNNISNPNSPRQSVTFSDDSQIKSKETPPSPRLTESGGFKRTISGLFSNKQSVNLSQGYHHVLVRFKSGDKLIKIPSETSKVVKKSKLMSLLLNFNPPVPFKLDSIDFKEINIPINNICEMEKKLTISEYKFGVIFSKGDQCTDDEMLSNNEGSREFYDFMDTIAQKIVLDKDWTHYNGGLDIHGSSSGKHSYYTLFRDYEVMFHVSTMLPYLEEDEQQVEKKRHIGNDVVVIIFQEGNTPFDPESIKSVFNHVFIVIRRCPDDPPQNFEEKNDALDIATSRGTIDVHELVKENSSSSLKSHSRTHSNNSVNSKDDHSSTGENFSSDEISDDTQNISDEVSSTTSTDSNKSNSYKKKKKRSSRKNGIVTEPITKRNSQRDIPSHLLNVKYRIEIVSKKGVAESSPKLPNPPIISGAYLKEFLMTKLINCERAAYFSPNFSKPLERAREMLLQQFYQSSK